MKLFRTHSKSMGITIRFTFTVILIAFLMVMINYIFLIFFTRYNLSQQEPTKTVKAIARELSHNNGRLTVLTEEIINRNNLWVQLVNPAGDVIYNSRNKPKDIESHYSLSSIAKLSKNYLNDYPVFVWESNKNLVILGYPKNSIIKYNWSFYSESFPRIFLWIIFLNIIAAIVLFIFLGRRLTNPIKRLIDGIFSLKQEQEVFLKEKGIYKDLADSINKTSIAMVEKNNEIRQRDNAIKNWIAGISHDVRTPLSMILGYSAVIEEDSVLSEEVRSQAKIITENAIRLRELVSNLNLATSLQYDMQPLELSIVRLGSIAREAAASCINSSIVENCKIKIMIEDENAAALMDKKLFERALLNLIMNSVKHNKADCIILVIVPKLNNKSESVSIIIADDGYGISEEKKNHLNQKDFFKPTINQTHGLGLIIVKSIVAAHHGEMVIKSKKGKGTAVIIRLPKAN
ncbi:MAG: HAMP domain-containing histidine kinase [Clostridia bacterium]|nr:HAMP domain-containing histidine kinase [Clostridia bacterium]